MIGSMSIMLPHTRSDPRFTSPIGQASPHFLRWGSGVEGFRIKRTPLFFGWNAVDLALAEHLNDSLSSIGCMVKRVTFHAVGLFGNGRPAYFGNFLYLAQSKPKSTLIAMIEAELNLEMRCAIYRHRFHSTAP